MNDDAVIIDRAAAGCLYPGVESIRMSSLPNTERPRELLERHGAAHLPDHLLLAILLRAGVPGRNVMAVARDLLARYDNSLTLLSRASIDDLIAIRGIGRVKAQTLKACLELGLRLAGEAMGARPSIRTPADAAGVLRARARREEREIFWVLPLDRKHRLLRAPIEVTSGLVDAALVDVREVFKEAVRAAAAAVLLGHNHPSGDMAPSAEDVRITKNLIEAGRLLGIPVLDHVVLGLAVSQDGPDYFSLRESGLVNFEE